MEFKKKTIIWEDNNEPPKDYIWIKSDGKAYEFDYNDRTWKESTFINVNTDGSDGGGGGSGSMSMYDAWMKAFDGFKVYQDNNDNNVLTVAPALCAIGAYDYQRKTSDTPISLAFMNAQTNEYSEYGEESISKIFDIKNVPDDIYEQSLNYGSSYIQLLYDLDELNEKAHDINYAVESIGLSHSTYNTKIVQSNKGKSEYVPNSGVFKLNDKFYIWFPVSMD